MPKYTAWISGYGSIEYVLETKEDINKDDLLQTFLDKAEPASAGLCYQCATHIDLDVCNIDETSLQLEDIVKE